MIKIIHSRGEVLVGGREVDLTPREYATLRALVNADGAICTRRQIMRQAWGYDVTQMDELVTRTVDQHVTRLRRKLGRVSKEAGEAIRTVLNRGYKLRIGR